MFSFGFFLRDLLPPRLGLLLRPLVNSYEYKVYLLSVVPISNDGHLIWGLDVQVSKHSISVTVEGHRMQLERDFVTTSVAVFKLGLLQRT